ncbi:MAG TPA: hypothetical protein VGI28_02550 [Stellaceae bacterium]
MIGKNHESESLGVLRWLTLAIAVALGILPLYFVRVIPPPSGPASMDLLKLRTIEMG